MLRLRRQVIHFVSTAGVAALLYGCPSSGVDTPPPDPLRADAAVDAGVVVHPDAEVGQDADPIDSGEIIDTGFKLRSADFAPATGSAGSPAHQLNGSFGGSSASGASSERHKLRGSLGPLGR